MARGDFLYDIKVGGGDAAYEWALNNPTLAGLLYTKSLELVRLYQARVGKKTSRLARSADASVDVGGRKKDRLVGKMTIADETVFAIDSDGAPALWKGGKFFYGEYHEEGTRRKGRRRRQKTGVDGYHELREVAQEWRSV